MLKYTILVTSIIILALVWIFTGGKKELNASKNYKTSIMTDTTKLKKATFGEGCFWCVEAVYQNLKGVYKVESGYSGGTVKNPSYEDICTGTTGHAEVALITYDPEIISFEQLLEVFWHTHDPTTLNRQGADRGTQYRSVIFYNNEEEKKTAEESKNKTQTSGLWSDPIVTEISPFTEFYKAEDYHQNYYNNNLSEPYCSIVIAPKLAKFYKEFGYLLKDIEEN